MDDYAGGESDARILPLKCPDCGFTGGHSRDCTYHQKQPGVSPAKSGRLMRLVLTSGAYIDIGPLPPDFNFQGAMNTIRLSGAWLSDNLFILKEQIGVVFCWDVGKEPPSITPAASWANDTGSTKN